MHVLLCLVCFSLDDEKSDDDNNQESPVESGEWRHGALTIKSAPLANKLLFFFFLNVILKSLFCHIVECFFFSNVS